MSVGSQAAPSKFRALAAGLSVGLHVFAIAFLPLGFSMPLQTPLQSVTSILLDLGKDWSETKASGTLPVEAARKSGQSANASAPNPLTQAPRFQWDEAGFRNRQARLNERIRAVRRQLRAVRTKHERNSQQPGGFQVISAEKYGPAWTQYLEGVRKKVLDLWYPLLLRSEANLTSSEIRVDFILNEDGSVSRHWVAQWTGSEKFRDLCAQSFRGALPFPPLPESVKRAKGNRDSMNVSLFFYYQ